MVRPGSDYLCQIWTRIREFRSDLDPELIILFWSDLDPDPDIWVESGSGYLDRIRKFGLDLDPDPIIWVRFGLDPIIWARSGSEFGFDE